MFTQGPRLNVFGQGLRPTFTQSIIPRPAGPFSTVREKADGKGHYARIMTRGLCAHNGMGIMRA